MRVRITDQRLQHGLRVRFCTCTSICTCTAYRRPTFLWQIPKGWNALLEASNSNPPLLSRVVKNIQCRKVAEAHCQPVFCAIILPVFWRHSRKSCLSMLRVSKKSSLHLTSNPSIFTWQHSRENGRRNTFWFMVCLGITPKLFPGAQW